MVTQTTDVPRRHSLTVEDYFRMAEVGILGPDDRVELIEGEIIDMPPIGELHAGTVAQLSHLLHRAVGDSDRAIVFSQNPAILGRHSAPQPDIALLAPRADYYKSGLPQPADMFLVVEVADTSLRYDRDVKAGLYARHAIPEYWLVDVRGKGLTRYRDPQSGAYARIDEPDLASQVDIGALPGVTLHLGELFAD
jgi:Uma2 family endonuclease